MSVKIIITRRIPQDKVSDVLPLLQQIRSLAIAQQGYISAETLINFNDPDEHVVISTWKSLEDWHRWTEDPERKMLHTRIENLLGSGATFSVYYNG